MSLRALVLVFTALSASARAEPGERVTAGALRDWPPQYSIDALGQPTGFAIDVLDEVAKVAGLEVEYRLYDTFPHLIADAEAGVIDVIPNYGITEERRSTMLFTRPVETFDLVLWVRSTSRDVRSLDDLRGRPIGTVRSNAGEIFVPNEGEVLYDDPRAALFDLLSGQVDGVVYPEPVLESLAIQAGVADRVRVVDPPLLEIRRAIAVRTDAPALRDRLDTALAAVLESPRYEAIYRKWYASPPPWWSKPGVARGAAAAAAIGLLALLVWRLRLQRRLLDEIEGRSAAEAARRRTERRLDEVMAAAPDGMFLADADGIYIDVNPAGCALVGHPREAILGRRLLDFLPPEERASTGPNLAAIRRGERIVSERRMVRADGSLVPVEISGSALADGTLIGIVRDITQRKRAQAELLEREHQLQQAQRLEAVGRLAGAVAHDFNNLLTVILNDAEYLRAATDPAASERAAEIADAARRAADLTQQLLAFGRRQVLQPAPTDPAVVVQALEKMLRRVLPAHVTLSLRVTPGQATILVDPGQLDQVLMNLVLNARDALGSEAGDIGLRCDTFDLRGDEAAAVRAPPGRYAVIEVSDTGQGMDADTLAQAFEPFFTTKALGEGTGLGLATVHGIVRQSGGWIDVRSEVGDGTTFRVGFPVTDAVPAPRSGDGATAPPAPGRGRVLVVEDEPAVRRLVVRALGSGGYIVLEAASGDEALKVASGVDLVAVITDVEMPGLGGPALAERLSVERPGLPVLFMSGYSDREMDSVLMGPHRGFLPKPFTPDKLRVALAEVIGAATR